MTDPQQPVGHEVEQHKEWWEEDGLPWNSKPTREDYWCLGWFGFVGVFGLAMIPLRAWLLGLDPPIMLALTGSRIGAASTGALASVGEAHNWLLFLLIGSLVAIKFDWIYWWAGTLWGRGILDVQASDLSVYDYHVVGTTMLLTQDGVDAAPFNANVAGFTSNIAAYRSRAPF